MPVASGIELLPIFRTAAQWVVLGTLFVDRPDDALSIAELARIGGLSTTATQREVERLVRAGLLEERRVGRNRLVSANPRHPAASGLQMLLALATGPLHALSALYVLPGVDLVIIHGSWARRYQGEPGTFPNDVDVLTIGQHIDEVDVRLAVQRLGTDLGSDLHVEVVTAGDWEDPDAESVLGAIKTAPFEVVPRP